MFWVRDIFKNDVFFRVSLAPKSYFLKMKVFFIELPFAIFVGFLFFSLYIYSQTRSSVPPKNPLMNLLFKSWIRC